MKKYFGFLAAMMLITILLVSESFAQPSGKGKMSGKSSTVGSRFVDANGDGICDNNTTGVAGAGMRNQGKTRPNFVDSDGDGICDNNITGTAGKGMRNQGKTGTNFVDVDGDGVCDNNTTGTAGAGMRNHGKTRPNFVDADGDGVCDNFNVNPPTIKK